MKVFDTERPVVGLPKRVLTKIGMVPEGTKADRGGALINHCAVGRVEALIVNGPQGSNTFTHATGSSFTCARCS